MIRWCASTSSSRKPRSSKSGRAYALPFFLLRSNRAHLIRAVRILLYAATALLTASFAPPHAPRTSSTQTATIRVAPISLDSSAPARRRLGHLAFLQGWVLTSDNPRFGGISAMQVGRDEILALSDTGSLIRFARPRSGVATARISPLPDGPGTTDLKRDRDSESMVVSGGAAWVGFEGRNAIWRYMLPDWQSASHVAPPTMASWPSNTGAEGMVRLPDGRFLVFSEGPTRPDGANEVLLFEGDPAIPGTPALSLGYRPPEGYNLTDASILPDGRLLLLNRRFRLLDGVSAKLVLLRHSDLIAGAMLDGKEIADFRPPVAVDNMEALSITSENGRTIVWIASDDNFSPLQRTLLLKFALTDSER